MISKENRQNPDMIRSDAQTPQEQVKKIAQERRNSLMNCRRLLLGKASSTTVEKRMSRLQILYLSLAVCLSVCLGKEDRERSFVVLKFTEGYLCHFSGTNA